MLVVAIDVAVIIVMFLIINLLVRPGEFFGFARLMAWGWMVTIPLPMALTIANLVLFLFNKTSWIWILVPYGVFGVIHGTRMVYQRIQGLQYWKIVHTLEPIVESKLNEYGLHHRYFMVYVADFKRKKGVFYIDRVGVRLRKGESTALNDYTQNRVLYDEIRRDLRKQFEKHQKDMRISHIVFDYA